MQHIQVKSCVSLKCKEHSPPALLLVPLFFCSVVRAALWWNIRLSAQSIVHLTAQIQIMETRVANFVWGCTGPYFGPTNTISTKNYQKNTRGPIFRKTTQNALQCTTVHCNVASYLLAPNGSNMTQNDPEWLTMPKDDIPEVKGAPGGQGGRQGARGGTRGRQMGPGYSRRQNKW